VQYAFSLVLPALTARSDPLFRAQATKWKTPAGAEATIGGKLPRSADSFNKDINVKQRDSSASRAAEARTVAGIVEYLSERGFVLGSAPGDGWCRSCTVLFFSLLHAHSLARVCRSPHLTSPLLSSMQAPASIIRLRTRS
jgi:hypothetical protein